MGGPLYRFVIILHLFRPVSPEHLFLWLLASIEWGVFLAQILEIAPCGAQALTIKDNF